MDWRTDEEEEGSRGDEDGGEEEGAGQEGDPPAGPGHQGEPLHQHPGQPLHHQMIFASQVSRGGDDNNLYTGPLSECASPLSEHSGAVRLYMMTGKQLGRTPPGDSVGSSESGNQAAHVGQVQAQGGPHAADGQAVQAQAPPTLGPATQAPPTSGAGALSATGEGTPVGCHKKAAQKKTLARCLKCRNCKHSSCPARRDPYICLSCLAKQSCALRPACISLSIEETKLWHQQVVERNNALAGKRTDILYHKVDVEAGLTPKTMDVAIVEDKSAKPKIYPSISAVMEQEEASVGNQTSETSRLAEQVEATVEKETSEDKFIAILKDFKL